MNATLSSSFKPASVALGPTPSILPGRELVGFDDVQEKYTFEKVRERTAYVCIAPNPLRAELTPRRLPFVGDWQRDRHRHPQSHR